MMEYMDNLGMKIRIERIRRGWSQAQLAQMAGLYQPHVSAIETGKADLRLKQAVRIFQALEISMDSIMYLHSGAEHGEHN